MHRESCVCGMKNLEFFKAPPPPNIALEESKWIEYYYPVSSTLNSDTAPIVFEIKGQWTNTWISLKLIFNWSVNSPRGTELT